MYILFKEPIKHHSRYIDFAATAGCLNIPLCFLDEIYDFLTEILKKNDLQRDRKRNRALSPTLQILVTLRFFASGSFLLVVGDTFDFPKSSV